MLYAVMYNTVLLGACLFAGLYGRWPERVGIAMLFVASHVTGVVRLLVGADFSKFESWVSGIDILVLVALIVLSLRADRFWPLWAAGFHLAGLATHLAVYVGGVPTPMAYAHGLIFWSYAVLAALVAGTWFEVVRPHRRPVYRA
ncbi:hypothetical protein [Parasphingopyxis sp.]|uniref:hypothetical protein n=1 Tax=Parasphingopyxis sp. TaxID=1920299 RepID=UPI002604727B|nr:hypothetical protein [uncultured Parasphingopyxis sp.]